MTPTEPIQSSGIGQVPVLLATPEGIALIRSRFPNLKVTDLLSWGKSRGHLDLGEMDLSQWPPRPKSLTGGTTGSSTGKGFPTQASREQRLEFLLTAQQVPAPSALELD